MSAATSQEKPADHNDQNHGDRDEDSLPDDSRDEDCAATNQSDDNSEHENQQGKRSIENSEIAERWFLLYICLCVKDTENHRFHKHTHTGNSTSLGPVHNLISVSTFCKVTNFLQDSDQCSFRGMFCMKCTTSLSDRLKSSDCRQNLCILAITCVFEQKLAFSFEVSSQLLFWQSERCCASSLHKLVSDCKLCIGDRIAMREFQRIYKEVKWSKQLYYLVLRLKTSLTL